MRSEEFGVMGDATIDIENPAGSVDLYGWDEPVAKVEVDASSPGLLDDVEISTGPGADGAMTVRIHVPSARATHRKSLVAHALDALLTGTSSNVPSARVAIWVPRTAAVRTHTASANITVRGGIRSLDIRTASGDINADDLGRLDADTASGAVKVDFVGEAHVRTSSGRIAIGTIDGGRLAARTASGDIDCRTVNTGDIEARTASGNITIAVVPGRAVAIDASSASGRLHSDIDFDEGLSARDDQAAPDITIRATSASGNIHIERLTPEGSSPM